MVSVEKISNPKYFFFVIIFRRSVEEKKEKNERRNYKKTKTKARTITQP